MKVALDVLGFLVLVALVVYCVWESRRRRRRREEP